MEIIGSIILSIFQSILFYGKEIGISMLVFNVIGNGIFYYIIYKKRKIKNKNGIFLIIPILLLSSTYFIFANKTFYITNIFALISLNLVMYAIVTNQKDSLRNYFYKTLNLLKATISKSKESLVYTEQNVKNNTNIKKINKENIKKVAISILIVFVIVGIIVILLASADSIFANLFSGITKIFKSINIKTVFSLIFRILLIVISYFLFLSFILKVQKEYEREEKQLKENNNKYNFTIKLLLITLNIVYLVFCYIQIKSLFAKINTDESFNYANYARSGFFQLMFVSIINFIILLVSNKCNENKEKIIKILSILLIIFTIIIAISSIYRMYMYETEYGLTYLRVFVYLILVTEIISLIPITIYIVNEKFDFLKWCFIIVICIYCLANYINIEKTIISKNVNRDKTNVPIDYNYIAVIISPDSYEILENKLEDENNTESEKLDILRILLKLANNQKELSWQEYNISKDNMKKRDINLQKIREQIKELEKKLQIQNKSGSIVSRKSENYIYNEVINEDEEYVVEQIDTAMGKAFWSIGKYTNNGTKYNEMSQIEVSTPSKIKFFENGLGFLERPTSIYCGASDLLVTYDSGKTFNVIKFPTGIFTISDSKGKKWEDCYDYFYLPTRSKDGTLTVLVSGGYEGGYNEGKTRAKYISYDNGYTWQFVEEGWRSVI